MENEKYEQLLSKNKDQILLEDIEDIKEETDNNKNSNSEKKRLFLIQDNIKKGIIKYEDLMIDDMVKILLL